jgi:hypothetical protein
VVERRPDRVAGGVHEEELLAVATLPPVGEPDGFADPVRYDGLVEDQPTDVLAQEPLGPDIVLPGPLGEGR